MPHRDDPLNIVNSDTRRPRERAGLVRRDHVLEELTSRTNTGALIAPAHYFRDQVLDQEDAETMGFLLRTAVLERMSEALCDAVLVTTGSAARLSEMESSNLFVVSQDRRGEWYRYHQPFAEMLLSELRRREPAQVPVLHNRAAAWFSERGLAQEAIHHALAGHDVATAARLTLMYARSFAVAGRIATVCNWCEAMSDEGPKAHPPLAVMSTWMWGQEGDEARARQDLRTAEKALFEGTPWDGSASLESGVRIIRNAMAPLGITQMLSDGRRAVELEPPGSRWHPFASWILGSAQLLHGHHNLAAKAFQRAVHLGRDGQKPAASLALAQLSLLAAQREDWPEAAVRAADAQELIGTGRLQDLATSMLSYAASARVAAHEGDREAALLNIRNAARLSSGGPRPVAFAWLTVQGAIVLGRALLELRDVSAANAKVGEAREHLARLGPFGHLGAQLQCLAGEVARHGGSTDDDPETIMTLTSAELRVLHLLPMHLTSPRSAVTWTSPATPSRPTSRPFTTSCRSRRGVRPCSGPATWACSGSDLRVGFGAVNDRWSAAFGRSHCAFRGH